jgi:hypothetical protein
VRSAPGATGAVSASFGRDRKTASP